jgi:hypothetical protein
MRDKSGKNENEREGRPIDWRERLAENEVRDVLKAYDIFAVLNNCASSAAKIIYISHAYCATKHISGFYPSHLIPSYLSYIIY